MSFPSSINLSYLNGTNGFRLDGAAGSNFSGWTVASAGDVNDDGLADLIIGAYGAGPNGGYSGSSYVVFGKTGGFSSTVNLSSLDGTTGFRLDGAARLNYSGVSVASAGDVNGDGFADVIIGANGVSGYTGASYVVFGKASGFAPTLNLASLDGSTGFRLDGVKKDDNSGLSVASAGDVNGDGFADIIIGTDHANGYAGASYVVFGKASGFDPSLNLASLDGSNGFRLDGVATNDRSGCSVASAGDVNGDGYADVIVGAHGVNGRAGASYVVFGKESGFDASISLSSLDGTTGFRLDGVKNDDNSGNSVASAGDVNGDGYADLIIGAYQADPNGGSSGASYVVFGKASGFGAAINLSSLNGSTGFRLDGVASGDQSGYSVASAGDVNNDGFADLIIGARWADPNGSTSGASYVVLGQGSGFAPAINLSSLNGSNGFRLDGVAADDLSGYSVASAGDLNGDGFADLIIGAYQADPNGSSSGSSYVVFGHAGNQAPSITAAATANFAENASGTVYTATGSDSDTSTILTYALGGTDAGLFNLDAASGAVTFKAAPDFEAPGDAGQNNVYDITLTASDGSLGSRAQAVAITVTNIDEAILGTEGPDTPTGSEQNDTLQGFGGAHNLFGQAGDDVLSGGDDNDTLDGGAGEDLALLSGTQPGYRFGVRDGVVITSGADGLDQFRNIERFQWGSATEISITSLAASASNVGLVYARLGDGEFAYSLPDAYTGPVAGIVNQQLGGGSGDIMFGSTLADFINAGTGDDAVDGGAGDDVIDGGLGSNFIGGGAGTDTFFLDGRAAATSTTWSTITDFQVGDRLTVWGYQPGPSKFLWVESDGAAGYKGATLHCDLDGNGRIDTSVTFTGMTYAQLPAPIYGSIEGNDYLFFS